LITNPLKIPVEFDGKRASQQMKTLQRETKKAEQSTQKLGDTGATSFGKYARNIGLASIALTAFYSLSKKAVNEFIKFEQAEISFQTLTGSIEKGNELLADTIKLAAKTPFRQDEAITGAKRLLAYGIEANQVTEYLRQLGDIASGVGREKLPNLILAFGQVKTATRLTGMELRQFTEAGVPLMDELAKVTGNTAAHIKDMVSRGEIGFDKVATAIENMTGAGGRFNEMMEKQSKTVGGMLSTLQDNFDIILRKGASALSSQYNMPAILKMVVDFTSEDSESRENKLKRFNRYLSNYNSELKELELVQRQLTRGEGRSLLDSIFGDNLEEVDKKIATTRSSIKAVEKLIAKENRPKEILKPKGADEGSSEQIDVISLRDNIATPEERLKASLNKNKEITLNYHTEMVEAERAVNSELIDINNNRGATTMELNEMLAEHAMSMGQDLLFAADGQSRALFNIGKVLTISDMAMQAYKAWGVTMGNYGYTPQGFIAAGIGASISALKIAKVASMKYGSSSGLSSSNGTTYRSPALSKNPSTSSSILTEARAISASRSSEGLFVSMDRNIETLVQETVKTREIANA
jgi:tape measure domain-containing protein